MTTIILANSRRQATAFAGLLGLRNRDYRFPYQASSLDGLLMRRVIVHPSFELRRDKHAIMATVRRGIRKTPGGRIVKINDKVLARLVASAAEAAETSLATRAAMRVLAEDD
jgi:hypothetical protein